MPNQPIFRIACALALITSSLCAAPAQADQLHHIGTFQWPSDAFEGLSGIEVSDDGSAFQIISDRGWYLAGEFERTRDKISGIDLQTFLPILGNNGLPVAARRLGDLSDAEGLAISSDGTQWISFERWAHVSRYDGPELSGQWIKDHPSFYDYRDNRQLEALAIRSDGALFTFPERPLKSGFPIYRLNEKLWEIDGYIQEKDGFSIVGADFDPADRLYLLERKLVLGLWWQSRVRRLDVGLPDEIETLWTSARGDYYNLEGIALWQDQDGDRITIVSDNNGDEDEPTQFVEFRVVQ